MLPAVEFNGHTLYRSPHHKYSGKQSEIETYLALGTPVMIKKAHHQEHTYLTEVKALTEVPDLVRP